jgi:hypothetical protein
MKPTAVKPLSRVRRLGAITAAVAISAIKPTLSIRPMTQWPAWAKAIAEQRQPGDAGLGDTLVHLIGDSRSEKFQAWFQEKFGQSCGCSDRQAWLNRQFPYQITAD